MERIVIVAYKPHPGKETELVELSRTHWEKLRKENLVSERQPVLMKASDGTVVEVFGWKSEEAMESAHSNAAIQEMWKAYAAICDYIPLAEVPESEELFSEFNPL